MVDPSLFDMMHGAAPTKSKKNNNPAPSTSAKELSKDELAFEEAIKREVDRILANEDPTANKLISPEVRRAKIEQEVRAAADSSKLEKYMTNAFKIMRVEGLTYLEKNEHETLQQNLDKFSERLRNLDPSELTSENLKAAMAIPLENQKSILKIAIAKFNEGLLEDSLAMFTFLTTVDEEEPDYWYRLGLVAHMGGNYDLALEAFTTTSQLAPSFIGAHIYLAECYCNNRKRGDATTELQKAKDLFNANKALEEWQGNIQEVESMLAKATVT